MMSNNLFDIPIDITFSGEKGEKGERGLRGDKGDKGENGRDGINGKDGINGIDGKDGRDGRDGINGRNGKDGQDGSDGLSAYEIWLQSNEGTEEDFISSLKGQDAEKWATWGYTNLTAVSPLVLPEPHDYISLDIPALVPLLINDVVPYSGATQDVDLNSKNLATTGQIVNRNVQASLSCGVHEGMEITINADPTKINIAPGSYTIVDCWTDPQIPMEYNIEYAGVTGIAVTNLASADFSYILIDKDQTIIQLTTFPTDAQHRNAVVLAQLGHTSRTSVASVNPQVEVFAAPIEQLRDYWSFFAIANKGNIVSANGVNLSINKSIGYLFSPGSNFYNEPKDPNVVEIAATTPSTFRRRTQTGAGASGVTTLDVGNYDVAGTITATTGVKYTNQRVYLFPNGNMIIQYGQAQYTNMSNAIAAIPTEPFIVFANIEGNAAFIGVISVRSTATDLSDSAQAIFTRVDALTGFPSGSSGTSTTTLQQAYENSNANPEILTDSTGGAVTIRRGSAADTDDVLNIQNNAGSATFSVKGNGGVTIDSTTSGILFPRMTTTQKNAISSPTDGLVVYDTTLNKLCVYTTAWETITSA